MLGPNTEFPQPEPLFGNEGVYPAKMAGAVDEHHDYDEAVTQVEKAGMLAVTRAEMVRSFGGEVPNLEVEAAVRAIAGVIHFRRTRTLKME